MTDENTETKDEEAAAEIVPELEQALEPAYSSKAANVFMAANDLAAVVNIISKTDNITPDEVIKRLNNMCEKGALLIVPSFGRGK